MSSDAPLPAPRFWLLNLFFGILLMGIGSYKTWESFRAAEAEGGGDVQIFWAAIGLGTILAIVGALQWVFRRKT